MLPATTPPPGKKRRQRLLAAFDKLDGAAQEQLMDFAEFLAQRHGDNPDEPPPDPRDIPRPPEESVIAAVRRLSETYPMLDKGPMLHETSTLVSAHVMQGRDAIEVIDELERLFEARYRALRSPAE